MLPPKVIVHEILTFLESPTDVTNVLLEKASEMLSRYTENSEGQNMRFVLQDATSLCTGDLPLIDEWEAHLTLICQDAVTVTVHVQWEHWDKPDLEIMWDQQLVPCFSLERTAPRELKAFPQTILIEQNYIGVSKFLISARHLTDWLVQP